MDWTGALLLPKGVRALPTQRASLLDPHGTELLYPWFLPRAWVVGEGLGRPGEVLTGFSQMQILWPNANLRRK